MEIDSALRASPLFRDLEPADGCLGMIVADVSGHGIGPALLMAETRAYLRSLARTEGDLEETFAAGR